MTGSEYTRQQQEEPLTDQGLEKLATEAGSTLLNAGLVCSTAESCTGGLVAKLLTDKPGSSAWFDHAEITYSNEAKQRMLGVSAETLDQWGAVSEEVVKEMATGSVQSGGSQVACAVSGVAGPDGGSESKPVGTVWIAWASVTAPGKPVQLSTRRCLFDGDRDRIRRAAAAEALNGIIRVSNGLT